MAKKHEEIHIWQLLGLVLVIFGGMAIYSDNSSLFGGSGDMPTFIIGVIAFVTGAISFWIFRKK